MISLFHSWLKRTQCAAVLGLCILFVALTRTTADELQPDHPRRHVAGDAFVRGTLQVLGGNEQSALKYYRDIVAPQMKFETTETIENSSIRNQLAYFGYPDVNARYLQQLSSDQLMALGADRGSILSLVLAQGLRTTAIGIFIGLAGALALTRYLRSLMFGVSPSDPAVFAGVTVLLFAVALLASYIPARRATRIDPMVALRDG